MSSQPSSEFYRSYFNVYFFVRDFIVGVSVISVALLETWILYPTYSNLFLQTIYENEHLKENSVLPLLVFLFSTFAINQILVQSANFAAYYFLPVIGCKPYFYRKYKIIDENYQIDGKPFYKYIFSRCVPFDLQELQFDDFYLTYPRIVNIILYTLYQYNKVSFERVQRLWSLVHLFRALTILQILFFIVGVFHTLSIIDPDFDILFALNSITILIPLLGFIVCISGQITILRQALNSELEYIISSLHYLKLKE